MTSWYIRRLQQKWNLLGRDVPCEKKWLRYVDHLDELLDLILMIAGSKKRCFHLAPEFPDGDKYWGCPNTL